MYRLNMTESQALSESNAKLFFQAALAEQMKGVVEYTKESFDGIRTDGLAILDRRLEVYNLPIKFSEGAMLLAAVLPDRVGALIVLLIDVLENYENDVVTVEKLAEIYPYGFYNEEALCKRIDQIKADRAEEARSIKYSYIY